MGQTAAFGSKNIEVKVVVTPTVNGAFAAISKKVVTMKFVRKAVRVNRKAYW